MRYCTLSICCICLSLTVSAQGEPPKEWQGKAYIDRLITLGQNAHNVEIGNARSFSIRQKTKVGDAGRFRGMVVQVINENEAHVRYRAISVRGPVYADQTPNFSTKDYRVHVIGKGRFKGVIDDAPFLDYVKVIGTTQYKTVTGAAATIWKLQTIDEKDLALPDKDDWKLSLDFRRDWKTKEGKLISGQFYSFERGVIEIIKTDRKIDTVKLIDLVADDQAHVRKLLASKATAEREKRKEAAQQKRRRR